MRKKLLSLLVLSVLVLSMLVSCHGKNVYGEADTSATENEGESTENYSALAPFVMPDEFDTSRKYEISFWAKNDTNKTQVNIYKKAIEDFEALYPNITVTLRLYNDYGKIYQDVLTNTATGTTPTVCITYPDHIATYMTGENAVVALTDLMQNPKYGLGGSEVKFDSPTVDEIVPKFLEECIIGGEYYALPYMRSTEACYVNKTYVEALGYELPETLTWDFVWEVSEAATAKNEDGTFKVNGKTTMLPFIYKSTDNMMITMLKQLGAGYSSVRGDILLFNETTRKLLGEIAAHTKAGAFSTFGISGYPANFLNAGQCIFAIDSTAGATWMGCEAPLIDISEENLVEFETVVMTIPQYDTENSTMISQGPSMCIFNKEDCGEVLASWLFCQYMLTNEVQIAYSQTEGYVPVTTKAQESDEDIDYLSRSGEVGDFYYSIKLDATKLLLDNVQNTFTTPVFNGSTSLRNAAGELIEDVTKSVKRKQDVDDAYIEALYERVTLLCRLDQIESSSGIAELGPLPTESVILIAGLGVVWVLIAISALVGAIKKVKKS